MSTRGPARAPRAVVFAYHDVGVRCLRTLLAHGVDVALVFTHLNSPTETIWFDSVARHARWHGIKTLTPENPNVSEVIDLVRMAQPDFLFSFYYRSLLRAPLLSSARRGALNMHGSLLPKFRGRAPVNWAILEGEHESGATLHYMLERADAGDIVDQLAIPILQDDDARAVFAKVTVAAETILARSLPGLIAGSAPRTPQAIAPGQYFGRRTPEDGRIDWCWPARRIHDLVRAVAPPFPSAFAMVGKERWEIHRTRLAGNAPPGFAAPRLYAAQGRCLIACADGQLLHLQAAADAHGMLDLESLAPQLAKHPVAL